MSTPLASGPWAVTHDGTLPTPASTLGTEAAVAAALTAVDGEPAIWCGNAKGFDVIRSNGDRVQVKRMWVVATSYEGRAWCGFPGPGAKPRDAFDPTLMDSIALVDLIRSGDAMTGEGARNSDRGWDISVALAFTAVRIFVVPVAVVNAHMERDGKSDSRFHILKDLSCYEI